MSASATALRRRRTIFTRRSQTTPSSRSSGSSSPRLSSSRCPSSAECRKPASATGTTNVSLGDLVDDLVSIGEIWRVKAGIVEFVDDAAQQALFIIVVSKTRPPVQRKGRARWIVRLPPGKYDVAASSDADQI